MTTQAGSTPKFGQCWGVEEGNRHTDTHSFPFPDTTDFQESFVTSGVFSVTELIQVSRSECPHPAGTRIREGLIQREGRWRVEGTSGRRLQEVKHLRERVDSGKRKNPITTSSLPRPLQLPSHKPRFLGRAVSRPFPEPKI